MPLPKRRFSSTRRDKRRANVKLKKILLHKCKTTGVFHEPHKVYEVKGRLYYRGKPV